MRIGEVGVETEAFVSSKNWPKQVLIRVLTTCFYYILKIHQNNLHKCFANWLFVVCQNMHHRD
jgi:hypothetical protein